MMLDDIHDVFDIADRISVVLQGRLVRTVDKTRVTTDQVPGMIILAKPPERLTGRELADSTADASATPTPRTTEVEP